MRSIERKPDIVTDFEARIRDEWIVAEAQAWADAEGIYKIRIAGAYLEGVNVTGLLTDYDIGHLESMAEDAILAEASERRAIGDIPGPYPMI